MMNLILISHSVSKGRKITLVEISKSNSWLMTLIMGKHYKFELIFDLTRYCNHCYRPNFVHKKVNRMHCFIDVLTQMNYCLTRCSRG